MPVWITKKLPIAEWGSVQFRLMMAQYEIKSSLQLAMLIRSGGIGNPDDVYLLIPDESVSKLFPGFSPISENRIPNGLKMVMGVESELRRMFPEIAAKIGTPAQVVEIVERGLETAEPT